MMLYYAMKRFLLLLYMTPLVSAFSQGIVPPVSDDFPFQVAIMMDGGTFVIIERSSEKSVRREFCIDSRLSLAKQVNGQGHKKRTIGEFYEGALYPTNAGAKAVNYERALKIFSEMHARLESYFGKEKLKKIEETPIDFEKQKSMSTEEEDKFLKDKDLQNRIACQMLLHAIEEYKQSKSRDAKGTSPNRSERNSLR